MSNLDADREQVLLRNAGLDNLRHDDKAERAREEARERAAGHDDYYVMSEEAYVPFGPLSATRARAEITAQLTRGEHPQLLHVVEDYKE